MNVQMVSASTDAVKVGALSSDSSYLQFIRTHDEVWLYDGSMMALSLALFLVVQPNCTKCEHNGAFLRKIVSSFKGRNIHSLISYTFKKEKKPKELTLFSRLLQVEPGRYQDL